MQVAEFMCNGASEAMRKKRKLDKYIKNNSEKYKFEEKDKHRASIKSTNSNNKIRRKVNWST